MVTIPVFETFQTYPHNWFVGLVIPPKNPFHIFPHYLDHFSVWISNMDLLDIVLEA